MGYIFLKYQDNWFHIKAKFQNYLRVEGWKKVSWKKKITFYEKANELFQFWPLLLRDTLELQFMKSNRSPIVAVKGKKKFEKRSNVLWCIHQHFPRKLDLLQGNSFWILIFITLQKLGCKICWLILIVVKIMIRQWILVMILLSGFVI